MCASIVEKHDRNAARVDITGGSWLWPVRTVPSLNLDLGLRCDFRALLVASLNLPACRSITVEGVIEMSRGEHASTRSSSAR